jgi:hypothetical protein
MHGSVFQPDFPKGFAVERIASVLIKSNHRGTSMQIDLMYGAVGNNPGMSVVH